jgi:Zn-dependent protease with chaperone function
MMVIRAGLIIVCLLFIFIAMYTFVRDLVRLPESWRYHTGSLQTEWIRLPASVESRAARSLLFRAIVLFLFLIGSAINILALLVSAEVICFALADRTIFFPQIRGMLSWIAVPFLAAGRLTNTTGAPIWDVAFRATLCTAAASPIVILGRRVAGRLYKLVSLVGGGVARLFRHDRVPQELRRTIETCCQENRLKQPQVRIIRSRAIELALIPRPFGWRPILVISKGTISHMTEQELAAAALHELGHIRQELGKLVFLRTVSTLGGFPPWFLLLLLDFRAMEEEADRFALRAGASADAMASAIIKATSVQVGGRSHAAGVLDWLRNRIPHWALKPYASALKTIQVLDRFLFQGELVGFSHPLPGDRIAAVLGWENTKQDIEGGCPS